MSNFSRQEILENIALHDCLSFQQAFEGIMGDCCDIDISTLTADDVREQCATWNASGENCSEYFVEAAIIGLAEFQTEAED